MSQISEPARRAKARLRPWYRSRTASGRALPDFVIIGTQKAATTALMRYIGEHPDVIVEPGVGEVHFFDRDWERGERCYRSSFPLRAALRRHHSRTGRAALTGEKTPYYLMHPLAPERARQTIPDARLIAILRNPVERAAAHHRMNSNAGVEPLDLLAAIDAEPERVDVALRELADGSRRGQGGPAQIFSYVTRGRYAEQLDRWLEHFPREQLVLVRSEDLGTDPDATYDAVLRHLGLASHRPVFTRHNEARRAYSVSPEARQRLDALFREPNCDLAARYGVSWTSPT